MSAAKQKEINLLGQMPAVKGRLRENVALDKVTWFRVGGPADVMFKPENELDLSEFLKKIGNDIPVFTLGVGSNLLVRDGGFRGVVIRLGREFAQIEQVGVDQLRVGAGALDGNAARFAAEKNLAGAEFLSGIPGSIGGALRMNAGAYGTEMKDVLISAIAYDGEGVRHEILAKDMGFSYRHSDIPGDWIFTEALLQLKIGDGAAIADKMKQIASSREESQPIKSRTGGSTFANPGGKKSWELIDAVGARGLTIGAAQISEKHCNFLINTGEATAQEIEAVGEEARRRVFEKFDTLLRWEIVRLGDALEQDTKMTERATS